MNVRKTMRVTAGLAMAVMAAWLLATAPTARAQATRFLGSITTINGDTLTVKTDAGDAHQVQVPSSAQLKRIAPGQTDLTKAEDMEFSGLAVGDRVLVTLDPNATGGTPQAARVIAIKQADVAKKQEAESEEWNQGVHGLVKSVDSGTGIIVVNTRAGTVTKAVTVNTSKATILKRYAPGSVRFDQAQPGPIGAIQPGDQLWARGTKSADGTAIDAQGIVSGSFRSIAGTILSTDTAASTVTVKDLTTKKPVTIHVTADAQMRRLDDNVATMIATRMKGNQAGGGNRPGNGGSGGGAGAGGGGGQRPFSQSGGGRAGAGDLESILDRAPNIQIAALKKNDAVMIVATEDASGINAIKLLAGVEPLLEAPEAQDLLSSWSLSSGSPDAAN
jgi:hypothetical protein